MTHISEQSNPAGAIPVYIASGPGGATVTDISGTITAGGTAQALDAARAGRRGFFVQNHSAGDVWINELGVAAVAASPSIRIGAGQLYETPAGAATATAISIIGAITGQSFTARVW